MSSSATRNVGKLEGEPAQAKLAEDATVVEQANTIASDSDEYPAVGPENPGDVKGSSDELLLRSISTGDREALGCLFQRYARLVRGLALRILQDTSEAEDLLQEVFLFIFRKSGIFDGSKSTGRSWIVQMTYQRAIDRRRYLGARHFYTREDLEGSDDILSSPSTMVGNHDPAFNSLVGTGAIARLFASLTEDQRHTLNLYFFEGYTFEEIAGQLKQSLRNIRNHYYRGLDKLRKQMIPAKLQGSSRNGKK